MININRPSPRTLPPDVFCQLPTGIPSLDALLIPTGQSKISGVAHNARTGFFGVIFGAAGSGKSVLALQLCCGFAFGSDDDESSREAVLVSEEAPETIKAKIRSFGLMDGNELRRHIGYDLHGMGRDGHSLVLVQTPIDPAQQKDKLSAIFSHLAEVSRRSEGKRKLLLCIDNADILKLAPMVGVSRQPVGAATAGMIYKNIRSECAEHGLNVWLTFEEQTAASQTAEDAQIATTPEAYAADIVFRLGAKLFPNGYRERSFEIVKAKHQPIRRGRHHFSIRGGTRKPPHGFVIYPSLATQLHVLGGRDGPGAETPKSRKPTGDPLTDYRLGVDTIDEAVTALNSLESRSGYIQQGTVSVLVSDLDSIASELAVHFALQDDDTTLFLTTLHGRSVLESMQSNYKSLKKRKLVVREMLPEQVSDGKMLCDIDSWIRDVRKTGATLKPKQAPMAKRVVLDNIFNWGGKFPLIQDSKHFLTALFDLLRKRQVAAFVVDMVEVGEGRNPLSDSLAAGLADHVFVLRHVELRAETSKVFSVQKLASLREPQSVWELKRTPDKIIAEDRFAFFKGVLGGHLEPVQINLSLFAESTGSPLDEYIRTHTRILKATFGQRIQVHVSNSHDYAAFQRNVATHYMNALGDCQVVSIDEIWLQQLGTQFLEPLPPQSQRARRYVTVGHQLAFGEAATKCYAIPERNNVGILTFDPEVLQFDIPGVHKVEDPDSVTWSDIVRRQCEYIAWCRKNVPESSQIGFYRMWERSDLPPGRKTPRKPAPEAGIFTLSMETRENCVSAYLELVHSLLDRSTPLTQKSSGKLNWNAKVDRAWLEEESGFTSGLIPGGESAWAGGLLLLLNLLTPWDLVRLSHCWYRRTYQERRYLFSRQWFTNWGTLGLDRPGLSFHALPKGSTGMPTPASGAWYFGILKGSTAINAGMTIIDQMTLPEDELHRYHRGIALPVSEEYYTKTDGVVVRRPIPYRQKFADFGKLYKCSPTKVKEIARASRCPFYRQTIHNYNDVSPLLMGLIVCATSEAVSGKYDQWLWRTEVDGTSSHEYETLKRKIRKYVMQAKSAYPSLRDGPPMVNRTDAGVVDDPQSAVAGSRDATGSKA